MSISMRIINSNGGAMELACKNTNGIDISDVIEPSSRNVETLKQNFSDLNIRHEYIGAELASAQKDVDVIYVNTAKRNYKANESAVPIVDKNMAGSDGNGVLVMKNAFRLISLQEPEMFVVETGLKIHTAASEAFASLPRYYIRQLIVKDARKCGYPMNKQKSFIIGTKRDFNLARTERMAAPLTHFLEKGVEILVKDEGTGMLRPFTSTEISRFYGFPDEYKFTGGNREVIKQITDSIGVGFASFLVNDVIKHYFNNCFANRRLCAI